MEKKLKPMGGLKLIALDKGAIINLCLLKIFKKDENLIDCVVKNAEKTQNTKDILELILKNTPEKIQKKLRDGRKILFLDYPKKKLRKDVKNMPLNEITKKGLVLNVPQFLLEVLEKNIVMNVVEKCFKEISIGNQLRIDLKVKITLIGKAALLLLENLLEIQVSIRNGVKNVLSGINILVKVVGLKIKRDLEKLIGWKSIIIKYLLLNYSKNIILILENKQIFVMAFGN